MADGHEIGSIYAKITADIGDFLAKMAEARAAMASTATSMKTSSGSISSDSDKIGRDTEKGLRRGERELSTFGRAADAASKHMSGGPFGLFGAIGNVVGILPKLESWTRSAATGFQTMLAGILPVGQASTQLLGIVGTLGSGLSALLGPLALVAGAAAILGAGFAALTFIGYTLADSLGVVLAILGSFVAPLLLLSALLGGLGLAFFLSGKQALGANSPFGYLAKQVGILEGEFKHLLRTLGADFMPIFLDVVRVAQQALMYFMQLAKMPLAEAMHSIATKGIAMLGQLVNGVASVLANPIRMAFQIAFSGTGGVQSEVDSWYHRMMAYLFTGSGMGKQQTMHIPVGTNLIQGTGKSAHVDGIFQPLIDWFNRHNFTAQGIGIGHQLIKGLSSSGVPASLGKIFQDAGTKAGQNFAKAFVEALITLPFLLIELINKGFMTGIQKALALVGVKVSTSAQNWGMSIQHDIGSAWNWVKSKASGIWNEIVSLVENPLSIHINWPSPPGWLSSLLGGAFGGGSTYHGGSNPSGGARGMGGPVRPATGGLIRGGIPGMDSVPALLTPGELVLNSAQQKAVMAGGGGGDVHVHIAGSVVTERELGEVVWTYLKRYKQAGNGGLFGRTA